jgi:hypothetical protein
MDTEQIIQNLQLAIRAVGAISLHGDILAEQQNFLNLYGVTSILQQTIRELQQELGDGGCNCGGGECEGHGECDVCEAGA